MEIDIIIGGPQGAGVESAGQIVLKAFAACGYEVFGSREYHSNIIGAHSYYNIKISERKKRCLSLPVDALLALDAESLFTHFMNLKDNGLLIYDSESDKKLEDLKSMDKHLKEKLLKFFESNGLEVKTSSVAYFLKKKGVEVVALPIKSLLKEVLKRTQVTSIAKVVNVLGVTIFLQILGLEKDSIKEAIEKQFGEKARFNLVAFEVASDYIKNLGNTLPKREGKRLVLGGNEIVAMGKIAGGLNFESFYPITPATDEALFIESKKLELKDPIVTLQSEDEIAAICMAIGASLAGARAATSTSGPGFSLMNEAISMAIQMEVPIVLTLWMRAGPSTGIATRTGQQDILFSVFSGHGDAQKIVLCSGDHVEAYHDAIKAMNWAEKFQIPVIHLLDKHLASSITTIDEDELKEVKIERWKKGEGKDYRRYEITEDGISPFLKIGEAVMINSSLEHDEYGFVSEDPEVREKMMLKRKRKFETIEKEIPEEDKFVRYGDGDLVFLSAGSTKNAILSAMEILKKDGIDVEFIQLRLLSPFPKIKDLLKSKEVVCVESNSMAQLKILLRANIGLEAKTIQKLNARPFYDSEIAMAVKKILNGHESVVVSFGS